MVLLAAAEIFLFMKSVALYLLIMIFGCPVFSQAQLQLAAQFSDNMVLQRNQPINIWGKGNPGEKINAHLGSVTTSAVVQQNGNWQIHFPAQPATTSPLQLLLAMGQEKIQLNNILIGDVWLCIGQSNMEWPMSRELHWKTEQQQADQPLVRFINPPPAGRYVYNMKFKDSLLQRLNEEKFYQWDGWKTSSSSTVASMSAVAYYFAKRIQQDVVVPVGLINLSIGGAPLESFIGTDALSADPVFKQKVKGNWIYNEALPVWIRQRGLQNLDSVPFIYGDENGPHHAFKPGFAYKSGVLPLKDFPISGVLVYQGESNAEEKERVDEYGKLFSLLVDQYRNNWSRPNLPFYWVQLSSIERPHWPTFRDEQRKLLEQIPNSGMAITTDHGLRNDVHPPNKKIVGERLALWALRDVYQKKIIPSGPLAVAATYKHNKVILSFKYADGLKTTDGAALREIAVDGNNATNAIIKKNSIHIAVDKKPQVVSYGWKPYSEGNLVNKADLPASTFILKID
jgi:sialate O-acetylesterase